MIHLIGPAVLASALAGIGVYGMLARRNAVLVLIGAELLLNAANVLLVTASAMPAGGLAAIPGPGRAAPGPADPLLSGQVLAIFVITLAAAEIGLGLAIVLLLFRTRRTIDLTGTTGLGEASPAYADEPGGRPDEPGPRPGEPTRRPGHPSGPGSGDAGRSPDPEPGTSEFVVVEPTGHRGGGRS